MEMPKQSKSSRAMQVESGQSAPRRGPRKKESGKRSVHDDRKVFSKDKVWRILGQCLSLSDLKACRLVSKEFNAKVLEQTDFKNRAIITLSLQQLTEFNVRVTKEKWKNLSLDVTNGTIVIETSKTYQIPNKPTYDWLVLLFGNIESVRLVRKSDNVTSWNKKELHPVLKQMFTLMRNVKKLCLDVFLFGDASLGLFGNFRGVLERLIELEVVRRTGTFEMENLKLDYVSVEKLKVFKLSTDQFSGGSFTWELCSPVENLFQAVMRIKENLTRLELDYGFSWLLKSASGTFTVFPSLISVRLSGVVIDQGYAADFIRVQPALEEIDLKIYSNGLWDLWWAIRAKQSTLKILRLEFAVVRSWIGHDAWNFLRDSTIEEFQLSFWQHLRLPQEAITSLFSSMPPTLRKFHLSKLLPEEGTGGISGTELRWLSPLISDLTLSDCGELVTDATVEWICRNFSRLQYLNLSHAGKRVTDYGFTGMSEKHEGSQFAISDLEGLKSLNLADCGCITDLTLIHLKFRELCQLDLSFNFGISHSACRVVIEQNPSLEKLTTMGLADTLEKAERSRPDYAGVETSIHGLRGIRVNSRLMWEWGTPTEWQLPDEDIMAVSGDNTEWDNFSGSYSGDDEIDLEYEEDDDDDDDL